MKDQEKEPGRVCRPLELSAFCAQPEQGDPQTQPLAAQVAKLERRATALDNLCGEMLACLHVNLLRGTLTTQNDEILKMLLEDWSRQRSSA